MSPWALPTWGIKQHQLTTKRLWSRLRSTLIKSVGSMALVQTTFWVSMAPLMRVGSGIRELVSKACRVLSSMARAIYRYKIGSGLLTTCPSISNLARLCQMESRVATGLKRRWWACHRVAKMAAARVLKSWTKVLKEVQILSELATRFLVNHRSRAAQISNRKDSHKRACNIVHLVRSFRTFSKARR